jgi:hypothetical protein
LTFREWLSSCGQYFTSIGKARRDLIDTKVLDGAPMWTRVWHAHLFWAARSGLFQLRSTIGFVWHSLLIRYYRICDRIFGGTHYARYQEEQRQAAERPKRKVAELKKQLQEREERRFNEETLYQALTNPHFVATNHTHQDR